ncbi:hypothetical protein J5N97_028836 [Dioscorea zingiberensis]|uniref:Pentatricopeptide repeat-containing protein n=1 Tax=Dioscorea zingiberensis TaxID=325984 RepID=A0A9D5C0F3_9LILI|nr:hypothetical protein J5N97_028836 [Dioscorea zingiberensis]
MLLLRRSATNLPLLRAITTKLLSISSSARPSTSFPPLLPIAQSSLDLDLDPSHIAASFREWFKDGAAPLCLLDRIYAALASCSDDDPSVDAALVPLRLPLSESLVLRVLRHRPNPSHPNLLLLRLKFFDWSGRQRHYRHSLSAFHAIFRILSRCSLTSVVHSLLRDFSDRAQHSFIPRFHHTLVVGYSVASRPDLALLILARIRFHGLDLDPFSYHVLTNSLIDSSDFDLADSLLSHLHSQGHSGPVSTSLRIKSLCRQNKLDEAIVYLGDIEMSQLGHRRELIDGGVGVLVHALCARGRFRDAGRIVHDFGAPYSYGVWIADLVTAGQLNAAMEFLEAKKSSEDYIPESEHYNMLISRLLQESRLDKVYDVLVEMREEGVVPDRATMNTTLCFFCKAGMVDVAVQLYKSRVELGLAPNKLVYNYLITALCRDGSVDEVCQVLEESMAHGYFPGRETFKILSNLLCREGKLDKMRKLLDDALQRDIRPVTYVYARYLAALCKAGHVEEACLVPHMVSGENAGIGRFRYIYTSLIHAFVVLRRVDVLPQLIIQMQERGHSPSRRLYREVICCMCELSKYDDVLNLLNKQLELKVLDKRTCYNYFIDGAGNAQKPELAREVYDRLIAAEIEPNLDTEILLLQSYLKSKRIGDARIFFYTLTEKREPSTKLYNIFITGLLEAGKTEQAVAFWREVRQKGLIPSLQCYEELVNALCLSKQYDTVVKVLDDFKETGRPVSAYLCNVLLLHTLKSRELLQAWVHSREDGHRETKSEEIIEETSASGRLMLGQLIAAFSGGIRMTENLDKLDELVEMFFPVDLFTYNLLLRALTMVGRMDYACDLFNRISKKGLEPNTWSYDIIVHGFCKIGRRKDAERWMVEMYRNGFHPTWCTISLYNRTP